MRLHKKTPAIALAFFLLLAAPAVAELATTGFADGRGGSGGAIVRVTNLAAEGPGSLRAALDTEGPRIVVFEAGGVIDKARAVDLAPTIMELFGGQVADGVFEGRPVPVRKQP